MAITLKYTHKGLHPIFWIIDEGGIALGYIEAYGEFSSDGGIIHMHDPEHDLNGFSFDSLNDLMREVREYFQ